MHSTGSLLADGVLEPDGTHRRVHRDPRAVPVPLSGLAPRLRRIPKHLRPALQVAADVEEHVPDELIGRERHRQLGGADDELATRAHPAIGVPLTGWRRRSGTPRGGQVPDMFPPFAATSSVAPIVRNFRLARTTTRLNQSISAVTGTPVAVSTRSASSLPLPVQASRGR